MEKKHATPHVLDIKNYNTSDFNFEKHNASDFELKIFARVRLWIENCTTCQILN